ncbi:MAG: hypothetical protein COB99_03915 [Sulfurimonas sp.]|nr:MAG: hypothetical protein COB99_03915 [Sulfurimonas sp.]
MQRKNYFLKTSRFNKNKRNGIAMIMAITVLVIIATIMALSLSLTTQTSKRTTDLYLYEQSVLLSHSAAEYALLKMSQSGPCNINNLNFNHGAGNLYNINIEMRYISLITSQCQMNANGIGRDYANVITNETSGTVLMDITVTVNANATTEPIRYFRRSIQKL